VGYKPEKGVFATLLALTNHLARTSLQLNGYQSRRVATSAGRVHVLEARGHGHLPPVALFHGISSAGVHFLPLLYRLRGRVRRLIAPDMPAHGFSDAPPVMRPEAMKDALVEAMDAVIDEPAVVFGNSMGGIAAIHYALARPERVRGLILASPSGASMDEAELRRFVRTFDLDSHGDALQFVDRLFARPSRMRHLFAWGVRRTFADPHVRGLLRCISPADMLRPEQLAALRMPVLLLWGKGERILPREHYEFFRRHLPRHTRIEEPEGLGHAPYLDDPRAVARQILTFTADVHHGRIAPAELPARAA
jgi:pimeloyl-ACP methyl ester carboxylesterase